MTNLAQNLTDTSKRHGDRTAIKLDATEISYRTLDDAASSVARLLRDLGVQPGDRVGLMLPNVPYFAIVYYGILRAGAVAVPMNVLLKERETEYYLADSGAKVLFAWHEFAGSPEPALGRPAQRASSSNRTRSIGSSRRWAIGRYPTRFVGCTTPL